MNRWGKLTILWLVLVALVAACAQIRSVPPERTVIENAYSVDPQLAWSSIPYDKGVVWTDDGIFLEAVWLYGNVKDGQTIASKSSTGGEPPVFRSDMRASDVAEFLVDSLAARGYNQVQAINLRPQDFGGVPGFRFELSLLSGDGLEMDGLAAGAVRDGTLHLIYYAGARIHYFQKHRVAVERIIDSVAFIT